MTGTMTLEEMEGRRVQWKTVDDSKKVYSKLNVNLEFGENEQAKLEPQRIRTFMLEYSQDGLDLADEGSDDLQEMLLLF